MADTDVKIMVQLIKQPQIWKQEEKGLKRFDVPVQENLNIATALVKDDTNDEGNELEGTIEHHQLEDVDHLEE